MPIQELGSEARRGARKSGSRDLRSGEMEFVFTAPISSLWDSVQMFYCKWTETLSHFHLLMFRVIFIKPERPGEPTG